MLKGKIPGIEILEKLQLPESKVYTTEFDRICSAREIFSEFEKRGTGISEGHVVATCSKEMKEKLVFMAHAYKTQSLELYGYVPPIVFITDNSGSLRGEPAGYLEGLLREISSSFEQANIPFEILGYTTREWKGGKSREKWLKNGRQRGPNGEGPGRLNDIQYTVFKGFGEKHGDIQNSYSLLGMAGYLKENIDGEALEWAYERVSKRSEQKKHIVHLSDGAPVDDSTLSVNPADFLTSHLHQVLTALQNDENTKVHLGYIYEALPKKYRENPYDSYSLLNPSGNAIEDFTKGILSSFLEVSMKDFIAQRKQKLSGILGSELASLGEEDVLFITRNFNPEILEILRDFGYSGIDILLHVSHPIEDINERIFRMNLGIIKHSGKDFGIEFGRLLPVLVHYPYHEHLQIIVENADTIDAIVMTLRNSDVYIQLTQGRDWQRKFFEKYRVLIEQNRLNKDILSFLIDGKCISEEDIDELYIILQFGNLETVKLLLGELKISYTEIKREKDILEYCDVNKLRNNMQLLKGKSITHNPQIELLRFSMSVNTLMLQAAIQYGVKSFKQLKSLREVLIRDYTPDNERLIFTYLIKRNKGVELAVDLTYKVPFSLGTSTFGLSKLTFTEGIQSFVGSFENLGFMGFFMLYLGYTSGNSIKKSIGKYRNDIKLGVKDAAILRMAYKKFKAIVDNVVALKYRNISKEMIDELEDCYEDIVGIQDEEVQKMIGVDRDKVKLQYNVLRVLYVISLFPDLSFLKNNSIADEILKYLQEILKFQPSYVIDNGFNYKFFLEQKSKLQGTFGADFGESANKGEMSVLRAEVLIAYNTLGVKPSATQDEVIQAYRKLVKEHHPDRHGGDDRKIKEVNTAKDIIDKYRGWN